LAQAILTGQAEMRTDLAEMRKVIAELKDATETTVAATAELKAASKEIHAEVKKAVRGLTVRAAWRTALLLTPLTMVSSVAGNRLTSFWDTGHWNTAAASTPPAPPQTMILDNRKFWLVLPPSPALPSSPSPPANKRDGWRLLAGPRGIR
jgi:hypothetical protein